LSTYLTKNWLAKLQTNTSKTAFYIINILFLQDYNFFTKNGKKILLLPTRAQNAPLLLTGDHFAPISRAQQKK
jgi:hypothetical protein